VLAALSTNICLINALLSGILIEGFESVSLIVSVFTTVVPSKSYLFIYATVSSGLTLKSPEYKGSRYRRCGPGDLEPATSQHLQKAAGILRSRKSRRAAHGAEK
jgi:hypothetical protein